LQVPTPTLLIVGGLDYGVIELAARNSCSMRNRLDIVRRRHLFESPAHWERRRRATNGCHYLCASRGAVDEYVLQRQGFKK
jgi:hypothetical protein